MGRLGGTVRRWTLKTLLLESENVSFLENPNQYFYFSSVFVTLHFKGFDSSRVPRGAALLHVVESKLQSEFGQTDTLCDF